MSSSGTVKVRQLGKSYGLGHANARAMNLRELLSARALIDRRRGTSERFHALEDVSFDVDAGERLGIIGANGAGKSTLLKIICQVTLPDVGTVELGGTVGSLLEVGTGFHPDLTGRENVYLNGAILGLTRREISRRFDEIVDFAGVERFLDTPVKRYSSGMHVRLGFAVAAHLEPDVLIVDEVLAVGDAAFQRKCLVKLKSLAADEGRTVIFVSHSQAAVEELCDRVVLLASGKLVYDGPMAEGLHRYHDAQEDREAATGHWDLLDRSNGHDPSGRPLIAGVTVRQGGEATPDVMRGHETHVEVAVRGLPLIDEVWIGVRLTSESGQSLATFIAPLKPDGEGPASDVLATLVIPELPFAPAHYRLDVGVVDMATGRPLDEVRSAAVMTLRHPELGTDAYRQRFGDGAVDVPSAWRVQAR